MNWEFHSVQTKDAVELVATYGTIMIEGLENWLRDHVEPAEKQEESGFAEYPEGFYKKEFSYRYTFSVGWYDKKHGYLKMGPIPYDIKIYRADSSTYASEVNVEFPVATRFRFIDNVPPIE